MKKRYFDFNKNMPADEKALLYVIEIIIAIVILVPIIAHFIRK